MGFLALVYLSKVVLPDCVYADLGYRGKSFVQKAQEIGIQVITVARRASKTFVLEARRWIVERTFAWLGKSRRLSKDYEPILSSSTAMIYLSMVRLMVRRISKMV